MEGNTRMKVRLLVSISGTRDGVLWPERGEVVDLPAAEAHDLHAARMVAYVDDDEAPEAAVAPKAETAALPKPRARKA